jgi:small subunit ribosomal protein S6
VHPYEVMLMLDPDADEARQNEVIERIRQIVEQGGGTFESVDTWGRLKLAYEIDHKGEAFYHIVNFTSSPETLDEVKRVLRITDDVMRHMVVRRTGRSHGKQAEDQAPVS